ncbi:MAG: hypothetical protein CFE45_24890, partial [Burkholderiales bacterium PBB5]
MKHHAWRHDPAAYTAAGPLAARWADVDTRRHVNNIAVYGLHHEARWRWLLAVAGEQAFPQNTVWLRPQHGVTEFWHECHYPAPVLAGTRLTRLDSHRLQLATALWQQGRAVGAQHSTLAAWAPGGQLLQPLPTALAGRLRAHVQAVAEGDHPDAPEPPPASPMPVGADQIGHYPQQATLASRYGDLDADGGSSEAAVMRAIEQARAATLQAAWAAAGGVPERDWVSLVVARIALHWAHHGAPPPRWRLAGAVLHIGRSSTVLRVAVFNDPIDTDADNATPPTLQAMADCVMVYTRPE